MPQVGWQHLFELDHGPGGRLVDTRHPTTRGRARADRLGDDIVVIDRDREIAHGTADELKRQVGGERVELVVADRADLAAAREALAAVAAGEVTVEGDAPGGRPMNQLLDAFADGAIVAKRNLIKIKRVPDLLVFTTLSPIMFVLLFGYAISRVMAWIGLLVRSPEVVNNASFIMIFPITFLANTFVPPDNFPTVLKTFAYWIPVSSVVQATRELFGNTNPAVPVPDYWSLQHPVAYSLLWVAIIPTIFVPLAVRQYTRAASR